MANVSGPSTIIVIRHAEKPGKYNGVDYNGVNATATTCGTDGAQDLTTVGWQRAGGLVTLFGPAPFGPRAGLATPDHLYASDPADKDNKTPSQRPFETLTPLAAALGSAGKPKKIHTDFAKKHYKDMVKDALTKSGVVLISWQHELIPLETDEQQHGICWEILHQTNTTATFPTIPVTWPKDAAGVARYDLILVFTRSLDNGQITNFQLLPQYLVAGDGPATAQQHAAG